MKNPLGQVKFVRLFTVTVLHLHVIMMKPENKLIISDYGLGFHYKTNATTTTQRQSDYKVEQSSFTLMAFYSKLVAVMVVIGLMETRLIAANVF